MGVGGITLASRTTLGCTPFSTQEQGRSSGQRELESLPRTELLDTGADHCLTILATVTMGENEPS